MRWFLLGFGPAVWFVDLCVGFAIVPVRGRGLHAGALVLVAIATVLSVQELRRRRDWYAVAGVALSALSVLLVAGNLLASLMLAPGDKP